MTKHTDKQTEHYYTQSPTSKMKTYTAVYSAGGHSMDFVTADGVFSKHSVDFGSDLLINTVAQEQKSKRLLDMGCGYGALGVMLGKIFSCHVTMFDINERAVQLARKNAKGLDVQVVQSDGLLNIEGSFDMIITNPPIRAGKAVYYKWFAESIDYLDEGGKFYCVIQKKQGAASAIKHLEGIYGNCQTIAKDKGYYIICCVK